MANWLRKVDPLHGVPRKGEVWAWGMYDLANQSFTLLINTLLFPIFFIAVIIGDQEKGEAAWGLTAGASLLLVAVLSPLVGAMADFKAAKKVGITVLGLVCVVVTCLLGLLPAGALWPAVVLYVIGNVAFALGENLVSAFLPELVGPGQLGRVSALGWALAYFGALVMLGLVGWVIWAMDWKDPGSWRPLFVAAGLWYLVFAIPTVVVLKERAKPQALPKGQTVWTVGFHRLVQTAREAAKFAELMKFLGIMLVYSMGVQAMIFFAAKLAAGFGFEGAELAWFLLPVTACGVAGALAGGWLQDKFGHRRVVHVYLWVWLATTGAIWALQQMPVSQAGSAEVLFWVVGCLVGTAMGGLGTVGRAMVGVLTPADRTAEFFGLWGLVTRLAGVVGVAGFGLLRAWNKDVAIGAMAAAFAVSIVLLFWVSEKKGLAEARRAELETGGSGTDARDAAAAAVNSGPVLDADARGVISQAAGASGSGGGGGPTAGGGERLP